MALAIEDRAALDFVLSLRRHWAGTVYPRLRADFDAAAPSPVPVNDPESLAPLVHGLATYPWFSWLERGSQKMLWRAVSDAVVRQGALPPGPDGPATVEVDPDLVLPDWYTDWDIHVQPGGVWSHDLAGRVYELGARLVMLGENDDYAFHRLFVETALPKRSYRRMVDLGCGFGKSAWPLKQAYPEAEVIGVDLALPCVDLAARRASERKLAVRFRQADAVATGLEGGAPTSSPPPCSCMRCRSTCCRRYSRRRRACWPPAACCASWISSVPATACATWPWWNTAPVTTSPSCRP
ncbi:class I SAM-dependent methyltransferase [Nitrospirillum sp. BR 11163]|uniref:class I SAM-dependent methyltransferase n=1 Tax=Nitrospirillum sp. BR 11163 TaxID=3104323 RepID=UPI002AFE6A60|nr:class I SAM-dependent methyltransferase [Nitrospirillum sp. BR 11163]MEA1673323.1 class I SAM-dependent methyltransferase [Nitrospirillum sp. BR 11163]